MPQSGTQTTGGLGVCTLAHPLTPPPSQSFLAFMWCLSKAEAVGERGTLFSWDDGSRDLGTGSPKVLYRDHSWPSSFKLQLETMAPRLFIHFSCIHSTNIQKTPTVTDLYLTRKKGLAHGGKARIPVLPVKEHR